MKIKLITTIEPDLKDVNTMNNLFTRYYEKEAVRCFACWRKFAGWLKDIDIYCLNLNEFDINGHTKNIFNKLGVNYIHNPDEKIKTHKCGFWNIPLSGIYFENMFEPDDVMIRIDLDFNIFNELDKELFLNIYKTKVLSHTKGSHPYLESKIGPLYNTGFVISKPQFNFYQNQYNKLKEFDIKLNNNCGIIDSIIITPNETNNSLEYPLLEELVVSYLDNVERIFLGVLESEELDDFNVNENYKFYHCHFEKNLLNLKLSNAIKLKDKLNCNFVNMLKIVLSKE